MLAGTLATRTHQHCHSSPCGREVVARFDHGRPSLPRSGRDRFHPVTDQSLERENLLTGTLATRTHQHCHSFRVVVRWSRGLITDGVEAIPTTIG